MKSGFLCEFAFKMVLSMDVIASVARRSHTVEIASSRTPRNDIGQLERKSVLIHVYSVLSVSPW
jgi:hypothetical protein